jgi:membrane protease YdiL (CAAX protease family)
MTVFVWLIGRVVSRGKIPPALAYWTGALAAALLFALGHLPLLFALIADPPFALVAAVVGLNTIFGLAYGVLFWRAGLEMAMFAHAGTHLVAAAMLWVAGL